MRVVSSGALWTISAAAAKKPPMQSITMQKDTVLYLGMDTLVEMSNT